MITIAGRRYRWRTLAGWAALAFIAFLTLEIILAGNGEEQLPQPGPVTLKLGSVVGNRLVSKAWSLDYKTIVASADGTTVDVDGVHGGLIFKNGKPYLRFRAAHVDANTVSSDLNAIGPIHIETIGGKIKRAFDTRNFLWTNAIQQLIVPGPATIHSDNDVMHVSSMTYNVRSGAMKVTGVHGNMKF